MSIEYDSFFLSIYYYTNLYKNIQKYTKIN